MCGRYVIARGDIVEHFKVEGASVEVTPSYNIAPTQQVPIVLERDGQRTLTPAKWGLLPAWVKDPKAFKASMFNARAESLAEKASFKGPLRRKRAVIPASGFYEWRREGNGKTPLYIQLEGEQPMGFAGLYDVWNDEVLSFTIITTTPNALMKTIHDRMPVILSPGDYDRWLDPALTHAEEVEDLLKPYGGKMSATVVTSAVNSPKNNRPELIAAA